MTSAPLSQDAFRREVDRRLIDSFSLMLALGLRNRSSVWKRVEAGTLVPPVIRISHTVAFWDRDAIPELSRQEGG